MRRGWSGSGCVVVGFWESGGEVCFFGGRQGLLTLKFGRIEVWRVWSCVFEGSGRTEEGRVRKEGGLKFWEGAGRRRERAMFGRLQLWRVRSCREGGVLGRFQFGGFQVIQVWRV